MTDRLMVWSVPLGRLIGRLSHPPSSRGHDEYARLSWMPVTFTEPPRAAMSRLRVSRVSVPPKLRLKGLAVSMSDAPMTLMDTFAVAGELVSPAASVAVTWKV